MGVNGQMVTSVNRVSTAPNTSILEPLILKPFHFETFQNLSKKLPFWNPCPFHFGTPIYIDILIP